MNHYRGSEIINIGVGKDLSIQELASIIKRVVGYKGSIAWDHTKPDGTPRKLLDISKAAKLGWQAKVPLEKGLQAEYAWFLKNYEYIK
jgi:GDP-L-fucose synthase